jgi:ATP-dependent RNA helicase RhlE
VRHRIHRVHRDKKRDLLVHLLKQTGDQALVFVRTKRGSDRLCRHLASSGLRAAAIHGDKSQNARTRALRDFKSGKTHILVATDIAARGLDIEQLPVVINFDLPMVAEDYIHRIGRTGRAGAEGQAVSLVSQDEMDMLRGIQRLVKTDMDFAMVAGF